MAKRKPRLPYEVWCGNTIFADFASHVDSLNFARSMSFGQDNTVSVYSGPSVIAKYTKGVPTPLNGSKVHV